MEITAAMNPGENTLELQVANIWRNALIGGVKYTAGPPDATTSYRRPWTSRDPGVTPDTPLQPSGLLGPVRIIQEH